MKLRCWGTRGSIPIPGEKTIRFGGNTPCVEITGSGNNRIVIDAGTGIINLGRSLMSREFAKGRGKLYILLSHTHWDHIQGLPFLIPTFIKGNHIYMRGPKFRNQSLYNIVSNQLNPVYSPLCDLKNLGAKFSISEFEDNKMKINGFAIRTIKLKHLSPCLGFRIEDDGKSIAYISDHEHREPGRADPAIVNFCRDADIVIHDSFFSGDELMAMPGWGHSSFEQSLDLASRAGVKKVLFFHYNPDHTDTDLILTRSRLNHESNVVFDFSDEARIFEV
ncbi:MAG: MBL fold metallo-hydrolase [bacterium]